METSTATLSLEPAIANLMLLDAPVMAVTMATGTTRHVNRATVILQALLRLYVIEIHQSVAVRPILEEQRVESASLALITWSLETMRVVPSASVLELLPPVAHQI